MKVRGALAAALILGLAVIGSPVAAMPSGVGAGYISSDNVEYIGHVPLNYDSAGAEVRDGYFYITNSRELRIYDVSDPEVPELTGSLLLPQTPYFPQEDIDTNGRIALIGPYVIDIEDKSNPRIISQHEGASHTITCLFDCKWAYTSGGRVIDLRDPAKPIYAGNWDKTVHWQVAPHDVTEVAPGLVVTSSKPIYYLDARKDPRDPRVLVAAYTPPDVDIVHGNEWPRLTRERYLLVGTEAVGPACNNQNGELMLWDTQGWEKTRSFKLKTRYQMSGLLPTEGSNPVNLFCAHWFQTHPSYRDGGLISMAWYEDGVRFLSVSKEAEVTEKGYFIPLGGSTSAAYWVTDRIVYAVDYHRGLEILRFNGTLR